jgi:hypothetical protein
MGNQMNVQQLTDLLVQNGYVEEMPGRYFYQDNMQGTWVNVNNGEVGVLMDDGTDHVNYDLTDPDDCYDAYVEALSYQFQIAEPSVNQAIRRQHRSRQLFDIMESVAPGRFNVPTVR